MLAFSGIEETLAHSAISFSLSRYTTEEDIDRATAITVESAQMLSRLSEQIISNGEIITP
jgi:cysteine desulfurase